MAKMPRIFQQIFGSTAPSSDIGVFGSLAAGAPATGTNLATLQSLSQFRDGWRAAILGNNSPAIEDMNSLFYLLTSQLAYHFQTGVPEWDTTTDYYTGSFVNFGGALYRSLADANTGNAPAISPTFWQLYDTTPSGVLYPYAGLTVPPGYGLCDGGTESRTARLSLFNSVTLQVTGTNGVSSNIISGLSTTAGMQIGWPISGANIPAGAVITSIDSATQIHISALTLGANAPGTAFVVAPWGVGDGTTTFNRPDLRGRTLIGAGTGAGLSARTLAALLGEENHVLTTGEMPSHNHGVSDPGHSHSIPFIHTSAQAGSGSTAVWDQSQSGGGAFTFGTNGSYTGISINNAGGGAGHNVIQPSRVANYIVKY